MATPRNHRGFSLTELLVVLGIILVLISMALPVIISSRKAARLTICVYRMHDLGEAIVMYQSHNGQALPLCQSGVNGAAPPYTIPEVTSYVSKADGMPLTIVDLLEPYLKTQQNMWACPMQAAGGTDRRIFFSPGFHGAPVHLTPGYRYLSTFEMLPWLDASKAADLDFARRYRAADWIARNVAGLKPIMLRPIGPSDSSSVVTLVERSSTYHSKSGDDMGELLLDNPMKTATFRMNALYLDSHVDTLTLKNCDDLLGHLHTPIRQKQCGVDFEATIPDAYVAPLPARRAGQ